MTEFIVKTIDPDFKRLFETVKHAVLYDFSEGSWKRTHIEGPLYVYGRTREPFHNMIIVSKVGTNNFIEPITEGIELQLINLFLILKKEGATHGIWFREEKHMLRVAVVLANFISQAYVDKYNKFRVQPWETRDVHKASPTVLTKPQGKCCSHTMINIGSSKICTCTICTEENSTTQNVLNFFTNARSKLILPGMPIGIYENIIQRLKSDPTYSLEYVENKQLDEVISKRIDSCSSGSGLQFKTPDFLARQLELEAVNIRPDQKIYYSNVGPLFPILCDFLRGRRMPPTVIPPVQDELAACSSNLAPNFIQSQQCFNPDPMQQLFPTVNNSQGATMPHPTVMIPSEDDGILASPPSIDTLLKRLFEK